MNRSKVLVVGAGEAGKSTLIQALVPGAMNLQVDGRTVAMDHAVLTRGTAALSLVGVPGQQRFGAVREVLATGASCAVWVHRCGTPVDAVTTALVSKLAARGVPYLVFVNRDDGDSGHDGWRTPSLCPEPVAIISGNALRSGPDLESLSGELFALATLNAKSIELSKGA